MHIQELIRETDKLKGVNRRAYVTDGSRHENSAEHSWHLCIALMAMRSFMPADLDLPHAIQMALVHDICEIGAGDISVYDPNRSAKAALEAVYMRRFRDSHGSFGAQAHRLWKEYEAQESRESKWVKAADRLLPFLMNLATEGKVWREQGIRQDQVIRINEPIAQVSPDLFAWMEREIAQAVANGWLQPAQ